MTKQAFRRFAACLLSGLFTGGFMSPPLAGAQQVATDRQLMFELLNRIEQLEHDIRQLRGDLEIYRYGQENLSRRLEALQAGTKSADTVAKPSEPHNKIDMPPERVKPAPVPPPQANLPAADLPVETAAPPTNRFAASPAAPATEQAAYDAALNLLREGRFEEAIASFQGFSRNYPDSELAGNAQYWLGEGYYVTRDFDNAKEAFINLGVNYPNNDKLPDALLKLGNIYLELGDKARAREVLQKLMQTYPNKQAASMAQKRLQTLR